MIGIFAVWWFQPQHIPHNFHGPWRILDVLLFGVVSYVIWHSIVMQILTWIIAGHIRDVSAKKPIRNKRVAFITTFVPGAESIELLHKTLPAMQRATYTHDTWLLDEGNNSEVQALCKTYGIHYFSRKPFDQYNTPTGKFATKTKAGNHNSWYDAHGTGYDFVAQIDTDFIPTRDFLTKTLGYFRDPDVAFVGTPQIYGNTGESLIARGAAEQTYRFYGPVLRGLCGMDSTLLIGANHVIRVAALEAIGHYSAHVTEDLLTGMELHAQGWKSVYVPEALAIGEGPSTWQAYFKQQMRWAYGCVHILFHHSPRLYKKMSKRQALYYFLLQQHYFSGLAMFLGITSLSMYFLFGLQVAHIALRPFIGFYVPTLAICGLLSLWLQRFNIRKQERGFLWAGRLLSLAVWPIFFLALCRVIAQKKLVYSVTPKGKQHSTPHNHSLELFAPHLAIGVLCIADLDAAVVAHRTAPLMLYWAASVAVLMILVPFCETIVTHAKTIARRITARVVSINDHYRILEFRAQDASGLPDAPTDIEKYRYTERKYNLLVVFSIISFSCIALSTFHFLLVNVFLWGLFAFLALSIVYFCMSLAVNLSTKSFDFDTHDSLVAAWRPKRYPTVDIFLPTAGEDIEVLENTWQGVRAIQQTYPGKVTPYCLDDGNRTEVKQLAKTFGFRYSVRPNRGEFKKAGNLRHGYNMSKGQFIAIFDADFRPRGDFLNEMLPYFESNPRIGIVQSPQYFDVDRAQNWLERGAGAVQELFYRFSQVSRQHHDASICVGSNAIYRRKALDDTGGTALIEHSEDVHTGFNMRMHGWTIQYIPVILAKGLCPAQMPAFFKQQYRWCMGSMSLLSSRKFWSAKLALRTRLSYMSGFLYYISTAITSFYTPFIPLILLIFMPDRIVLSNYLLIFPAIIFTQIIYPVWHESIYGVEAWATRSVYGWAHVFAIYDALIKRPMPWQPTGAKGHKKDYRYLTFRWLQVIFNFIPAVAWTGIAAYDAIARNHFNFLPILFSGAYYLCYTAKVTFYTTSNISFLPTQKFKLWRTRRVKDSLPESL